jgi:hypothetical protein
VLTRLVFGGDSTALKSFWEILGGYKEVTFEFSREATEWVTVVGDPANIAKAIIETLGINPEMEAEMKTDETTTILTLQDRPEKIEETVSKNKGATLNFRFKSD